MRFDNPELRAIRRLRITWAARLAVPVAAALLATSCSSSDPGSGQKEGGADKAVELFDASEIHSIEVEFDPSDYDEMIDAYTTTDDKAWIEATVTVDGATYERAGLRLKGNSSLMGLGRGAPSDESEEGEDPASTTTTERAGSQEPPGGGPAGRGGLPGLGGGADADTPEMLPWLIRLDEFVKDQRHQGYADIVVRSNSSKTSLNEALALDLLDTTSLATQKAISTTFAVNDGDPVLRLAVEHPDDDKWQDRVFGSSGALYKAESTGDWSYRGEDPASYEDVFDQEGGKKVADLSPLIDLLEFINESDDETFAAELTDHLHVEEFAVYLALMELLGNFDDIDGPGNNAYLWWEADTEQFRVVPWDLNLAFGAMGGMGDMGDMPAGGTPEGFDPSQIPDGVSIPEGFDPRQIPSVQPTAGGPGGPFGGSNILVQRFHDVPQFEEVYQDYLEFYRSDLFASTAARSMLDARVETLTQATDLVEADTVEEEADALRRQIETIAAGGD